MSVYTLFPETRRQEKKKPVLNIIAIVITTKARKT